MPAGRFPVAKKKPVQPLAPAGAQGPVKAPPQQKPVQAPAGAQGPVKVKPEKPLTPAPPPVPILQKYGYQGSMQDFVNRLREVTQAHEETFGYKPSPGFAFDLVRFQGPQTFHQLFGADQRKPAQDDKQTEDALLAAARQGDYHGYLEKNPLAQDLVKRKPGLAVRALGVATAAQAGELTSDVLPEAKRPVHEASFFGLKFRRVDNPVSNTIWRGASQVADSLVHSPGGLYSAAGAVGKDTQAAVKPGFVPGPHVKGGFSFSRSRALGKGMAKQTAEDFRHPLRNPGYLFLDILGVASAGAGTATRLGAAGRAARAGESAGVIGKALVRRPPPETYEIGLPGAKENALLSENSAVRAVQKVVYGQRQKRFEARQMRGVEPAGLSSVLIPERARDWLQQHFSWETKIGREARTRLRYENHLAMGLKNELEHAAGASINQARVFSRTPKRLRKGLTRGEQKAIQAMSWDDPNPLQAERAFHQRLIDGADPADTDFIRNHKRQLADLQLAEKVLKNPRPQFLKALELTRRVIEEQQRIKIEDLGLDPGVAEASIAKSGQRLRGEEAVGGKRQREESFYLPQIPKGKAKRPPYSRQIAPRSGPFGVPPPRPLPELSHVNEGKAIQAGDYRIDATGLAGETYARTVRAATTLNEYKRLWNAGRETTTPTRWERPIRKVQAVSDELRKVYSRIDEGTFTAKDAAELHPDDIQLIHKTLAPGRYNETTGRWELDEPLKDVRWVDSRTMAFIDKPPPPSMRTAELINEVPRDVTLYARPAYILNLLGNGGMAAFDDLAFVPDVGRAVFSKQIYGEEAVSRMESLVGEGKSKSYVSTGPKPGRAMASFWSRITDRDMRVSRLIKQFHSLGWSDAEIPAKLMDPANKKDVIAAARRANKSMVEFDNLTWVEQAYLRHFIFVYPWVSRSGVWSLRTIMEHPIKTGVLSHLGRMNEQDMDPYFKHAPEWFKRTGYFPVGWDKDRPKIVNPTSVNSFSTLSELLYTAESGGTNVPYASSQDLLGPFGQFMIHGITGRDDFGNEYPGGDWAGAAKDVLHNLPQYQMLHPKKQKDGKAPAFDVTDRSSLGKRERAGLEATVFSPGWLQGYGSFLAGGFSPKLYDPDAAAARFWATQPMEARHKHEESLINKALDLQAKFLKRDIPKDVRFGVDYALERELGYKTWQHENGRDPTVMEKTKLDLALLEQKNRISDADASKIRERLKDSPDDVETIRARMLEKFSHANDYQAWDEDVRWVASFKPQIVQQDLAALKAAGLGAHATPARQEILTELGRRTLEYRHEAKKLHDQEHGTYDLQVWEDERNKPIRINGVEYPSPVQLVWAHKKPSEREADLVALATKSWHLMSQFDRALVGKKTKSMSGQWQYFDTLYKYWTNQYHLQGKTVPSGYKQQLAKYIDKTPGGKGFLRDFYFDQKPMYERLPLMRPIQKSPNHDSWVNLIGQARDYARTYANGYNKTSVKAYWKQTVDTQIIPDLKKPENKSFYREVQLYGKNFLYGLIS